MPALLVAVSAVLILVLVLGRGGASAGAPRRAPATAATTAAPRSSPPYAVARRTITIVERRTVRLRDGQVVPRRLVTYVRYPANGRGPFGLIVFGHGFAVTPAPYAALLDAWAAAGFVVAAPVFPLENANAPGGPDESDLLNQPGDMSAVITRMLVLTRSGPAPWRGLIEPRQIAVAGQSDGGETAFAVAYDRYYLDTRVRAAVILSGARLPIAGFAFPAGSPPLFAAQGTADTINRPAYTYQFFAAAARPKFLLKLLGAQHLPPYTTEQPQLGIVERSSIAFLDRYLYGRPRAAGRLVSAGRVPGVATLTADP